MLKKYKNKSLFSQKTMIIMCKNFKKAKNLNERLSILNRCIISKNFEKLLISDILIMNIFTKALVFASRKHQYQRRKNDKNVPYINHPI